MDAFPDAGDHLARPGGPGHPVKPAAGLQLAGGFAGMVRGPARGRLGFSGLQLARSAPGLVGLDDVGFYPDWQRHGCPGDWADFVIGERSPGGE